ncbi:hypothetical protein MKZ38_005205 [Zalerion maritima]|uniref:Inositolphosphotransferase Aur1/Ipt1 domain-containing protein n=1 Tax=Zalerion maritima TaxID=339359 RepID=A0AAD5RY81_9PEZI|nr:hypothetical protein MKZ38_005205 [Zalerion maritima]
MGVGAFLEPLIVVSLLATGTIVNRDKFFSLSTKPSTIDRRPRKRSDSYDDTESGRSSPSGTKTSGAALGGWSSTSTLSGGEDGSERWRRRTLRLWGWKRTVTTPNTRVFEDRFLSRLLRQFPFLVEAWYWALIYWVYQIGRAITALTMVKDTVDIAREHALQLIHLEKKLHLFFELGVQKWFLGHPTLMHWTNRLYSFVHIPGTIAFLIILYYITTTKYRGTSGASTPSSGNTSPDRSSSPFTSSSLSRRRFGPHVYEARRRTMAMCNLIAFVIFTLWPCMPPRLLSDPNYDGEYAEEAKGYGFVDTVHGTEGESSVWTTNKFCNQYAAMPSLHFGYSFLIGLTIATLPIQGSRGLSLKRVGIIALGLTYPSMILAAIVSTANHFVIDAIAGACVCCMAWYGNEFLLNLLALEDYFLWLVRIHKPLPNETLADERDWKYEIVDMSTENNNSDSNDKATSKELDFPKETFSRMVHEIGQRFVPADARGGELGKGQAAVDALQQAAEEYPKAVFKEISSESLQEEYQD